MRIDQLTINGFGKFDSKEMNFVKGLNIVYGGNESGKSTLQAFIKAMLFDLDKNEEIKFLPWQGSGFGVSNVIQYTLDNDQRYLVEKNFNRKTTTVYLTDPFEDITPLFPVRKKNVLFMEEQCGITESVFAASVHISQQGVRVPPRNYKDLTERLVRLSQYGDENIDYNNAVKILDEQKDMIGTGSSGKYKKLILANQQIDILQKEREKAYENIRAVEELQQKIKKLSEDKLQLSQEINELLNINQYKKEVMIGHYNQLRERLEQHRAHQHRIKDSLVLYQRFGVIEKESLEKLQSSYQEVKLHKKQYEEICNRLSQHSTKLESVQASETQRSTSTEDTLRVELMEERIQEWQTRLLWGRAIGGILAIADVVAGVVVGHGNPIGYSILIAFPALLWWIARSEGVTRKRILQMENKIQQYRGAFLNSVEQQANKGIIESLQADADRLQKQIEEHSRYLFEELKRMGLDCEEVESVPALLHEIRQGWETFHSLTGKQEALQKEIDVTQEALNAVEGLLGNNRKSNEECFDEETLPELYAKYNLHRHSKVEELEELVGVRQEQLKDIELQIHSIDKEIELLSQYYAHPGDIEEKLESVLQEKTAYEETKEAVDLAKDFLQQSLKEVQQDFVPQMNRQMSRVFSKITGEKYNCVNSNSDLELVVNDGQHGYLPVELLSGGTVDQVYLAMRIAMAEILSVKETLPLMIDEAFAQYDDERLKNVLMFLVNAAKTRQVVLFTCRRKELELLDELKQPYYMMKI